MQPKGARILTLSLTVSRHTTVVILQCKATNLGLLLFETVFAVPLSLLLLLSHAPAPLGPDPPPPFPPQPYPGSGVHSASPEVHRRCQIVSSYCCRVTSVVFSNAFTDSTYAGHHILLLLTTTLAKPRSQMTEYPPQNQIVTTSLHQSLYMDSDVKD